MPRERNSSVADLYEVNSDIVFIVSALSLLIDTVLGFEMLQFTYGSIWSVSND